MVSKNNFKNKMEQTAARTPHYGIRKLSVGVASVLISTTLYMGATTAKADTLPSIATDAAITNPETTSSSSSTQTNATADNTAKTTVPTTASSTDTSVSTTSNAQASTTNTTAGATSSDKSSANSNSLVTNNVESTANTTAQTQPKPDVVTSDKANVDNQVGSNAENKATTTTDTISAPTTLKRVVRSLAAAPTKVYSYTSTDIPSNVDKSKLTKEVTRTINVHNPNGTVDTTVQTVTYHQTVTVAGDEVVYNNDWNTPHNYWDTFNVPQIENYKASKDTVDSSWVDGVNKQNETVDITYTTTRQVVNGSWTFKYTDKMTSEEIMPSTTIHAQFIRDIDSDAHKYGDWTYVPNSFSQTGTHVNVQDPIKENDITDHSDSMDTFKFSVHMPDDPNDRYQQIYDTYNVTFKLYNDNQQAPTLDKTSIAPYEHKIIYKETTVEVPLNYEFQIVLPDATHLIVAPTKDHLNGRRLDNVAYTVKQTIKGEAPYDKITGTFDYTKFSIDEGQQFVIPGRTLPQNIDNYYIVKAIGETTESNQYVGLTVQELLTKLQAHNYFALPTWETYLPLTSDDVNFTFVTKEEQGITKAVAYNDLSIHSSMVMFDPNIGIEILTENDQPFVSFRYTIAKEETKTVTRTIELQLPMKPTQTIKQTAILTRDQYQATNEPLYKDQWSKYTTAWHDSEWSAYTVPTVDGYTASQNEILVTKVTDTTKDQTIRVTYTANPQSIKINYVDDEKGGATVKSDTLNGKTDETVKTGITIPENYSVVGTTPSEYTFKANGNTDITVHLKHVIDTTSEEKTVTRTIKVTDPTGKVTTIPQTTKVTRSVSTDKVTNQKTYGDWTSSSFDSYDVPTIEGYTASQSKVDEAIVDGNSKDSEINISYTANDQVIKINYIDSDNNDSVVKSDTLNGNIDQTVKTNINIPEGYTIEEQVPTDYTFKASGNTDITVKLKHGTTTVTPDKPKTTNDKLPDNPSKNYPSGVAESDLNKNVTRTIKVTDPQGKVTTTIQTVHLTRSATVDEVTGKVTYDDWTTGSFDSYDVPSVEGYTASQDKVDTATVTSDTQNSEVNITYTANDQAIKINYIDSDNNGSVVKSDTLSGKTDQTVKTGITIPDGYVIEGNVPTDYTFKAKDNADITVKLKHGTTTVTPDKPKTANDKLPDNPTKSYPEGVAENDLNKTVTRTINVTTPDGKTSTTTQTVHLTRTATVDEVTGEVVYSKWSTGSFDNYDAPVVEGYTPSQDRINEARVTSDSTNSEVNVTYTPNGQSINITYVDDDNGGATVDSYILAGKTDETIATGIEIPTGYIANSEVPSEYSFKANGNTDITVHLKHEIKTDADYKNVLRTIKVTLPNGKSESLVQVATLSREVKTDKVTNNVSYGSWSSDKFTSYKLPSIEGYTPSLDVVNEAKVDGNTEDSTVEVNYTANKQSAKVVYVDNGKVVATQTLAGKTDQTVKTNIQSPDKDKYVVVGDNPESYIFKTKDNVDIKVEVKHVINDSTESKNITRTIVVTRPDGKKTTEVQKVTVSRTVHTDAVTGAKTYDEWSKAILDKYDVPVIDGYTPSLNVVEGLEVDGDSEDSVVKVGYTANDQTAKIVYVDGDNGGSTVKTDILNGKTDEIVKTGIKIPEGYVVSGNVLTDYTFKSKDNADITVKLKHGTTTVTPDKPKTTNDKLPDNPSKAYPEGVSENDLNKVVTRTIKITTPDGKTSVTTQTVHLTRTATVDEVTGEVTYSDWSTGKWDNYKIPAIEGYDSNVDQVDGQEVTFDTKNQTVEVSYTKLAVSDGSTTPVKEENNTETPKQSQDKVQSKFVDTELPQTGEKDNKKVSALGAVIASLAAGLGLAGIRRKKDKN